MVEKEKIKGQTIDQDGNPITSPQGDLFPKELIELEKDRIRSYDKRTEIAKHAIDASNEADKRQYDYHMAKLEVESQQFKQRFAFGKQIVLILAIFVSVLISILIGFSLLGTTDQIAVAILLLKGLFTALGGYGVVSLVIRVLRSAFK